MEMRPTLSKSVITNPTFWTFQIFLFNKKEYWNSIHNLFLIILNCVTNQSDFMELEL